MGIHKGAVTHHHDQLMFPVNLRTRNIRKRTVPSPNPPFAFDSLLIINV